MNFARRLALAAVLLAVSVPLAADEAADTFNKLYGDDLKRVAATPSTADDVALARQLLEAAGKVANQKALLTLLCEKAHELAIKDPTGYPTAKAAMDLLAASAAEKKVESLQVEKQIAALKARLSVDPKDASSRKEIVRLYLVEMDNPAEAAKFLNEAMDAATRKYVPAAAKPVEEAPEAACTEMGDWYRGLADQATAPASKGAMLERAKAYYTRFVDLHKADDVARAGATLMLMKIDDALAKLGPAVVGMPGSSSLTLDLGKGVTMKLALIRPGKFTMGSPDSEQDRRDKEGPQHEVVITKPFYMGATEVTQAQYEAVMGTNPSKYRGPTNPVENVSWEDAGEFCRKLSEKTGKAVRLPTEAEWEYACRAGTKTRFSFGDSDSDLGDYAWCGRNSGGKTNPVGRKKPNPWGLYDMHGNVGEWCADWYGSYSIKASTDPQGAGSGDRRVSRGLSWVVAGPDRFRCAYR
jgi:formylglycine-generating enzyme required for sulfatase activity